MTYGRGFCSAAVWPSAGGSAQTTKRMIGFVAAADFPECMKAEVVCLLDPPYYFELSQSQVIAQVGGHQENG